MRDFARIALFALVTTLLVGCTFDKESKKKLKSATALLNKYDLHISKKVKSVIFDLDDKMLRSNTLFYVASSKIGYDLEKYQGKKVKADVYRLREKSQNAGSNTIDAYIFYDGPLIIGGHLSLEGYMPGILSLTDKSEFKPITLLPQKHKFIGINKIEILGPWDSNNTAYPWTNKHDYIGESLPSILSSINNSKAIHSELQEQYSREGNVYMIIVYYADGPQIRLRYKKDLNKFTIDGFNEWYYEPAKTLSDLITVESYRQESSKDW